MLKFVNSKGEELLVVSDKLMEVKKMPLGGIFIKTMSGITIELPNFTKVDNFLAVMSASQGQASVKVNIETGRVELIASN